MDPTIAPTDPAMIDPLVHPELYENRSAHVVAAAVVLLTLPTIAVTLRLLSRRIARAGLWVDDYVVVLALVLSWGPNIINLLAVRRGFGKHIAVLPLDLTTEWFKYLYAFQFLYILCMSCVKYSIIYFMYRIFPIVQFRRLLKASLYFVIALTIASVFVTVFQCVPIRDVWDTWVGQVEGRGRCIDIQLYFIISGVIHVFTDFALLAMPIPLLWRLKTGKPQKWLLTAIFTVGLTVCIVSIIKIIVLSDFDKKDITWSYVPAACWTAAEPSTAVVSACLPSLRPLFARLWKPTPIPTLGCKHHNRTASTHGSFNRLQDFGPVSVLSSSASGGEQARKEQWGVNSVTVLGGFARARRGGHDGEEVEDEGEVEEEVPAGRIRAKTEVVVSISERVDWRDDLF